MKQNQKNYYESNKEKHLKLAENIMKLLKINFQMNRKKKREKQK